MDAAWFRSVQALGPDRWEAATGGAVATGGAAFTSYPWALFGEQVYRSAEHHYLLSGGAGGAASAAVSSSRRTEPLPISRPLLRTIAGAWLQRRPLLMCQVPVAPVSGLFFSEGGIPAREKALREMLEELGRHLNSIGGSFLIFPYLDKRIAHSPVWGRDTFRATLPPGTHLPIAWQDFEAYLFSRRNSVRKDYRLHTNRAERLGLTTRIVSELPEPATALQLIRTVERRHRSAHNPVAADLIAAAPLVGGKWLIVEQEGRLVGCGLVLQDRGELLLTLLGLDGTTPQVYFCLMYGAIRYAIETSASVLHGGGGAYSFKSRLGYRTAENVHIRAYSANPWFRLLGKRLAGSASAEAARNWPEPSTQHAEFGKRQAGRG